MTDAEITALAGLRDWLTDHAEKLEDEGFANGAAGRRAWSDAVGAILAEREVMRGALAYIAENDIAFMVCPRPVPRGYPGHYGQIAKDALAALSAAPKEPKHGDLLDCPFCGSSDVFVIDLEDEDGRFAAAGCSGCGAGSRQHYYCGDDAKDFAADAWNRRPTPPPVPAVTREELGAVVIGFRAKSATTQYESGHALQPSDCIRLTDIILSRLAAGQQGGGHD